MSITSNGWVSNSGDELFTLGWVSGDVAEQPDCLPIIGQSWLADCPEQHYSLGWLCCDAEFIPLEPEVGGGSPSGADKIRRHHVPGVTTNKAIAMREDEEFIAILQAYVAAHRRIKN